MRLLKALLEAFNGPDALFCNCLAQGVRLGSEKRRLPRTPALYARKTKWALNDPDLNLHGTWQINYSFLREHETTVLRQYGAEIGTGMRVKCATSEPPS